MLVTAICTRADYIRTNAPFMTLQVWTAEVNKMINAFGAPIAPEDAKTIIGDHYPALSVALIPGDLPLYCSDEHRGEADPSQPDS